MWIGGVTPDLGAHHREQHLQKSPNQHEADYGAENRPIVGFAARPLMSPEEQH